MLIITADDWGMNAKATNSILTCFRLGSLTSCSAMVYMADSIRSSQKALENGLDVGLHLNFIAPFTSTGASSTLIHSHEQVRRFLSKSRYHSVFYHPWLRKHFDYLFRKQYDEFLRLYGKEPSHLDGHRHLHLCMNVILDNILPMGSTIRRNHTFNVGEKDAVTRLYRRIVDRRLAARYRITDYFFDVWPFESIGRIIEIVKLSGNYTVELMVHPERPAQFRFITGPEFCDLMQDAPRGSFADFSRSIKMTATESESPSEESACKGQDHPQIISS